MLLSSAGSLGLDLKNTQSLHIMEPTWNEATIQQIIGRVVRYNSHTQSHKSVIQPIQIIKYYCYKPYHFWFLSIFSKHESSRTESADIYLKRFSEKKEKINKKFMQYLIPLSIEKSQGCPVKSSMI